jgi:hypothetical protein
MSIPEKAIDRLFQRLGATYGRQWSSMWEGVPLSDVKSAWSHELSVFSDRLNAIAWALENLPGKCPNVIEFKQLCRQAPAPAVAMLDLPKAPAQVVDKEIAKIAAQAFKPPVDDQGRVDHTRWIRRLKDRQAKGEKLNSYQVSSMRRAEINLGRIKE